MMHRQYLHLIARPARRREREKVLRQRGQGSPYGAIEMEHSESTDSALPGAEGLPVGGCHRNRMLGLLCSPTIDSSKGKSKLCRPFHG